MSRWRFEMVEDRNFNFSRQTFLYTL